jgi:hypothetical protein
MKINIQFYFLQIVDELKIRKLSIVRGSVLWGSVIHDIYIHTYMKLRMYTFGTCVLHIHEESGAS